MPIINSIINRLNAARFRKIEHFQTHPVQVQEAALLHLVHTARNTEWGRRYRYAELRDVADFQQKVPLQTYEDVKPFVNRMRGGERDVLWPGNVAWYAKSSGTTGDKSKFIPVTGDALRSCHFRGGYDVLALYARQNPKTKVFTSKTLTLGGSHEIYRGGGGSRYGDLSAILIENIPRWAEWVRTPPTKVALLADFDRKIDEIARLSVRKHVVAFTGVPSWNMVLMKHILAHTGKRNIMEVWPDMELFIHGGVSFEPYREQYRRLFPSPAMHYFETYNASEGFFALQDDPTRSDMLLMLDYGVFYEFIPTDQMDNDFPQAITIGEVETNRQYAIVITTNAGLWRYIIGDTVVFTSTAPHRIRISGRTRQYINAFGEEIIVDNAETALREACLATGATIAEYTAGPVYMDANNNGAHEWLIEFEREPSDMAVFTETLDRALCSLNSDYEAKRMRSVTLRMPVVRAIAGGTFYKWMKQRGKLGGQNKVPRLSNNRKYLDDILLMIPS